MTIASLAQPQVLTQPVYEPGKPIDDVARELGLDPARIVKLASNENPFGPSPKAQAAIQAAAAQLHLYPDGGSFRLREAIAAHLGLEPGQIVPGNGSNELIELLGHALLSPGEELVMGRPAFIVFQLVASLFGARAVEVPLHAWAHDLCAMRAAVTARTKLVCVGTPNNPTGGANGAAELLAFARDLPAHVVLVVDHAYVEFARDAASAVELLRAREHVAVLRTFSKVYGLAGMRLGYAACSPALAALLHRVRQPFNVNSLAQAAAIAALGDQEFVSDCVEQTRRGIDQLLTGLSALGVEGVPSEANFLLARVGRGRDCFRDLQARGVIVRPMDPYGMPEYIRVSVGTAEQNETFLRALEAWRR